MVTNIELSAAEDNVVGVARKLLGDNLADFLLSGLGEADNSRRRSFTARSTLPQSDGITYQLEMFSDSESGLPTGRDPIVLSVLLSLLWERQPLHSTILFKEADIIERLEWDNNAESRRLIKQAIERYFFTTYGLIDPVVSGEEGFSGRYASVGRLLLGVENTAILSSAKRTGQPRSMRVHFYPSLIHDVISQKKFFLGIDFQALEGIIQFPTSEV
ncbi:MAG TPA: hypothetical protein VGC66_09595 [Pyrinomonadaceae bacterium]|jgi:hypothetical protein